MRAWRQWEKAAAGPDTWGSFHVEFDLGGPSGRSGRNTRGSTAGFGFAFSFEDLEDLLAQAMSGLGADSGGGSPWGQRRRGRRRAGPGTAGDSDAWWWQHAWQEQWAEWEQQQGEEQERRRRRSWAGNPGGAWSAGSDSQMQSSLRALELTSAASLDAKTLRAAFLRAAKQWHPDRHAPEARAQAEARFKEAQAAYDYLLAAVA